MDLMELIETRNLQVVDQLDRPLSADHLPNICGVRAAHIFLRSDDGHLVLQRTGPSHRHPDVVGSSVAGFVLRGETYEQAARRRLPEELGTTATTLVLIGTIRSPELNSFKFSAVFLATAQDIRVAMPGHVGTIEHWENADFDRALATDPLQFTPTFPYVYPLVRAFLTDN